MLRYFVVSVMLSCFFAISSIGPASGLADGKTIGHKTTPTCADQVFRFQTNFWVNLHLFLRAESRRRRMNGPLELSSGSLSSEQQVAWKTSLDAYDTIAQSSLFEEGLVRIVNILSAERDLSPLPASVFDPSITGALNRAAPIYRTHLWPQQEEQDEAWISANCADVQRYDQRVKQGIAASLHVPSPEQPVLVDLARETGPTLAYTTAGPIGTSGHTIMAPQKNTDRITSLNTIFHEISHTMADAALISVINTEAARQQLRPPDDLWHAITLYTTTEITKRVLAADPSAMATLDEERTRMFERNGWHGILLALDKDWRPYLDNKVDFSSAVMEIVRDTAKSQSVSPVSALLWPKVGWDTTHVQPRSADRLTDWPQ
jgi:hypothetical protein